MTCSHVPITKQHVDELTLVRCACGHHWREAPIRLSTEEYDLWLVLLDLHLPRKTP